MYISPFSLLTLCCLSSYDFFNSLNIDTVVLIDSEFAEGTNLLQKIPCGLLHVGNCKLNILVTNTWRTFERKSQTYLEFVFKYKHDCLTRFPKFMK
jgi:hypothetical protein